MAVSAASCTHAQREANSGGQHAPMDMDASNASLGMDSEQLGFLKALQAAEASGQAHLLDDMNMMGMNPNDASMQSLLQMLTQQEQENARPDEHYLTIAQNGRNTYYVASVRVKKTNLILFIRCL
jgi:hypothetical protein